MMDKAGKPLRVRMLRRIRREVHYRKSAAAAVLFFTAMGAAFITQAYRQSQDFRVYYTAGARIVEGNTDIYRLSDGDMPFKYIPSFALFMAPWSLLPERSARIVWAMLNFASLVFTLVIFSRSLYRNADYPLVATLAAAILLQPLSDHFMDGQINLILLAMVCAGWRLMQRKGRTARLAGAALFAVGTIVKIYPMLFLLYYIRKRHMRLVLYIIILYIVIAAIPFLFYSPETVGHLYEGWKKILFDTPNIVDLAGSKNQSFLGMFLRFGIPHSVAVALHWSMVLLFSMVAFFRISPRRSHNFNVMTAVEFSLLSLPMVLSCPLTWIHYYVFHIPAIILVIGQCLYGRPGLRRYWFVGLYLLLITAVPTRMVVGTAVRNFFYFYSNYVIATIGLFIIIFIRGEPAGISGVRSRQRHPTR